MAEPPSVPTRIVHSDVVIAIGLANAFALVVASAIAIWMSGPVRALDEIAIARLSLHGGLF